MCSSWSPTAKNRNDVLKKYGTRLNSSRYFRKKPILEDLTLCHKKIRSISILSSFFPETRETHTNNFRRLHLVIRNVFNFSHFPWLRLDSINELVNALGLRHSSTFGIRQFGCVRFPPLKRWDAKSTIMRPQMLFTRRAAYLHSQMFDSVSRIKKNSERTFTIVKFEYFIHRGAKYVENWTPLTRAREQKTFRDQLSEIFF